MDKFNRNYKLTIQDNLGSTNYEKSFFDNKNIRLTPAKKEIIDGTAVETFGSTAVVVEPPFTIEVDIKRVIGTGSISEATIKIYNLNEKNRSKLFKDRYVQNFVQQEVYVRTVVLEAGYGKKLYPIFIGTLVYGYSVREGTEQITELYCISSAIGLYNTFINQSYGPNTPHQKVIEDIIAKLEETEEAKKGAITIIDGIHRNGAIALGNAFTIMSNYGFEVFVDLAQINVLKLNDALKSINAEIPVISSETGLLGTPLRSGNYVEVKTLLEPKIRLGEVVELRSDTNKFFNGQYKVYEVKHKGIFSQTKEGKMITTLSLYVGAKALGGFTFV